MAQQGRKTRGKAGYMISAVAEMYNLHPQTLRLYEREGLLAPSRSQGNTRLYTDEDLEQLEVILKLTRELGVNLAGVEIILNMRKQMAEMEKEMRAFVEYVRTEFRARAGEPEEQNALVRVGPPSLSRVGQRTRTP
jgi:MerR family transcriptional regulator/heat shock protein HspR